MQLAERLEQVNQTLTDLRSQIKTSGVAGTDFTYASTKLSDILSAIATDAIDLEGVAKHITVKFVTCKKDKIFVSRVFPSVDYSNAGTCAVDDYLKSLVLDHADRTALQKEWTELPDWILELDMNVLTGDDHATVTGLNRLPTECITAMVVLDLLNVAASADVNDLVYDTYCENYFPTPPYTRDAMRVLYRLFIVPVIEACCCKNWLMTGNEVKMAERLHVTLGEVKEELGEYAEAFEFGIGVIVKYNGSHFIKSSQDRYLEISQRMLWCLRYANDYTKRRNYLRDDLILLSQCTGSLALRAIYMALLDNMGIEMHERYNRFVLAAPCCECLNIVDEPNFLEKYSFDFSIKKRSPWNVGFAQLRSAQESSLALKNKLRRKFGHKGPLLPSDHRVDMIFVDIDRMECQFDRRHVLDEIYECLEAIDAFEQFYADDEVVMKRYQSEIQILRERLDDARTEVLNKRNFKSNYKVFVEYPAGYEG